MTGEWPIGISGAIHGFALDLLRVIRNGLEDTARIVGKRAGESYVDLGGTSTASDEIIFLEH